MKKPAISLSIPKPCAENWDTMTQNKKGRHCASCDKTVIDFSLFSEKELVEFFKNLPANICGHIPAYRLNTILATPPKRRFPFLHRFMWGAAIASWLGLNEKADAQSTSAQT